MGTEFTKKEFLAHVAKHEMTIEMDNGINRHIRFANPETINQSFQLTTWRDHLCFSGDMGTFVFSRVEDMFRFFRRDELSINTGYWHEKLHAVDRSAGSLKYSQEVFEETIKEHFEDWVSDEEISKKVKAEAWEEVKDEIICKSEFECEARHTVDDFVSNYGFEITDFWEECLNEYTPRFIWCLYAIVWGIQQYDKAIKEMNILHLPLKKKWFDMILSGEKMEEYREVKDHWRKRFCEKKDFKKFDIIRFTNGYGADCPSFDIEFKGFRLGKGREEWGAELKRDYFVLKLGKILKTRNLKGGV